MRARHATREVAPASLYPQLRPRRKGLPRAYVEANQRTRLRGAMIEAVAEHGYAATTVRRLRALAGVSEKTVYDLFPSKEAYFLDTYDFVVRSAVGRISAAYRGERLEARPDGRSERAWATGLCRAFDAFVEEIVARPKAARLALVEVLAAGPAALARIERGEAIFERMILQSLRQAPDGMTLSPVLVKGIVGGVWYAACMHVLEGRSAAMSGSGRELLEWMLSYRSPAAQVLDQASVQAPSPRDARERAVGGDGDERTRMLLAAAQIAARGGYGALTSGQIADRAGVEQERFQELFKSVEECFLAALERLSVQALAAALCEAQDAPDWPSAACRAIRCLLYQLARDPVFARVAFIEVFAAGPAGMQRRAALMRSFAEVLARRAPREQRPSPLVAEAIVGAVWRIVHHLVAHDGTRALPALASHAAYMTLAPIVGAERAVEAILAERTAGVQREVA